LIAPHSLASRDMTVKIVVPTHGSFESMANEEGIIMVYSKIALLSG
jgi:hypothetical protein